MKMRMLVVTLLLSAGVMNTFAQDASNCTVNSSISHEAVRAGNYKDAYEPWKEVMKDCPTLRYYTYTDGFKILKSFLSQTPKGTPEYKAYFDELMATHDQLIQYVPEMSKTVKLRNPASYLGNKAEDYVQFAPDADINVAYKMLTESTSSEKSESSPNVLFFFLQMSMEKLKTDPAHKEQFIQDYLNASQWTEEAIADPNTKPNIKRALEPIKENLVALFINSGAADCASLQEIYAPKVEENKTDLEYLKKVISIMKMMGCTEEDAYFQAAYYSYQIEPTADAAAGCAYMAYKKGDYDGTVKFFDEAINLEEDNLKKADFAYRGAATLYQAKRFSQARNYAQKAINYNPNYGEPYLLIATLYASSPKWSDEPVLNKCTYFLVIDKLQRAKALNPDLAPEVNKLIGTYSAYTPAASDLFMLGHKAGDRITIGGWIGETTTIR